MHFSQPSHPENDEEQCAKHSHHDIQNVPQHAVV